MNKTGRMKDSFEVSFAYLDKFRIRQRAVWRETLLGCVSRVQRSLE